jgi:hypothetical protein
MNFVCSMRPAAMARPAQAGRAANEFGVADCVADRVWLAIPQPAEWQCFGKLALCWSASATMPQFAAKAD